MKRLSTILRRWCFRRAPRLALRRWKASRAELGLAGEQLAARALGREGWRLRGRRLRTPAGEVDLWATDEHVSLVVEVKSGRLPWRAPAREAPGRAGWDLRWRPGLSLGLEQRRRLFRAARWLASRRHLRAEVGLVEVLVSHDGRRVEVLSTARVLEPRGPPYTHPPP